MVDSEISERGWQRKVTMGGGQKKVYMGEWAEKGIYAP